MNHLVSPRFVPGKKQICALMSRPLGSSARVVMTRCFRNGGTLSYALRLLPSPLNTIGRSSPFPPERIAEVGAEPAGVGSATPVTIRAESAITVTSVRRISASPSASRLEWRIERLGGDEALEAV